MPLHEASIMCCHHTYNLYICIALSSNKISQIAILIHSNNTRNHQRQHTYSAELIPAL